MPTYRVLRKKFWSATGPIEPGQLVTLPAEVGDGFPGNLALVEPSAPPLSVEPEAVEAEPVKRRKAKE